jgi:hypothetical protein
VFARASKLDGSVKAGAGVNAYGRRIVISATVMRPSSMARTNPLLRGLLRVASSDDLSKRSGFQGESQNEPCFVFPGRLRSYKRESPLISGAHSMPQARTGVFQ